jgi:hypothetical protein
MFSFGKNARKKSLPIDYHRKKLENPFFKRKEKIIIFSGLKAKLIIGIVIVFFSLSGWFLLFSPFWETKNISITSSDINKEEISKIVDDQINKERFLFFQPQKNLFFFKEARLYQTLKNRYRFQKIEVKKNFPNKLEVAVTEKALACVWNEAGRYYYIDADGYVLGEVSPLDIQQRTCPLIANESLNLINDSKIGADSLLINFAIQIFQGLPEKSLGIEIDHFISDQETNTLKIQTTEGQKISFDTTGDAAKQLEKLAALKLQKLKDDFKNKKKIDLRFGDKIYYQ